MKLGKRRLGQGYVRISVLWRTIGGSSFAHLRLQSAAMERLLGRDYLGALTSPLWLWRGVWRLSRGYDSSLAQGSALSDSLHTTWHAWPDRMKHMVPCLGDGGMEGRVSRTLVPAHFMNRLMGDTLGPSSVHLEVISGVLAYSVSVPLQWVWHMKVHVSAGDRCKMQALEAVGH
jgi:hypothetical protein